MNETHVLWRMLQVIFRMLYLPYKRLTCPALRDGAMTKRTKQP
jgi:hypothetical protein